MFISNNLSRYSSANNHLIGEASGLFVATVTWPFYENFKNYNKKSMQILIDQVSIQTADDGGNREQAIAYQQFVLDFCLIAALTGRAYGIEFPQKFWKTIEGMMEYISSIMDAEGNIPMIGDADDGYVVSLSHEKDFCNYHSLMATGAVLFNRSDFKKLAKKFDDKSLCFLGKKGGDIFNNIKQELNFSVNRNVLSQSGFYIFGKNLGASNEIRGMIDCGSLGYLSIAAHGHADSLAFYLSVAGHEILIDPGTYAYHTKMKWRNYFRGTSAHNTIRIDDKNQSIIGGNFMWLKHANSVCEKWESTSEFDFFSGYHDGYTRLNDPVLHRRIVKYIKEINEFIIFDSLSCEQSHKVERFWHFSEKCDVEIIENTVVACNDRVRVTISPSEPTCTIDLCKGNEDSPLGWVSRRYDFKVPTWTAVFTDTILKSTKLETTVKIYT
jgi:hypothetical protein